MTKRERGRGRGPSECLHEANTPVLLLARKEADGPVPPTLWRLLRVAPPCGGGHHQRHSVCACGWIFRHTPYVSLPLFCQVLPRNFLQPRVSLDRSARSSTCLSHTNYTCVQAPNPWESELPLSGPSMGVLHFDPDFQCARVGLDWPLLFWLSSV